jgi:hypothetical protein
VNEWLAGQGVEISETDDADARAYPIENAALARREATAGSNSPQLIPVLSQIIANRVAPPSARSEAAARAEAIARSAHAPGTVIAFFAVAGVEYGAADNPARTRDRLAMLAGDPVISGDPRARALVGLSLADVQPRRDRLPLLQKIADDTAMTPADPLRVGALTRLATTEAALGNLSAAQAAYARTGLNDEACALVDARPALKSMKTDASMFPTEALQWGLEGWAVLNFDIGADGRPQNVRAVIAYPPLVFAKAAIAATNTARYTQSYRPAGGLGCSGELRSQRFLIEHQ